MHTQEAELNPPELTACACSPSAGEVETGGALGLVASQAGSVTELQVQKETLP